MKNQKLDPKIAKAYQKVLWNDVMIGLFMLVPIGYIVYSLIKWRCVIQSPVRFVVFILALILVAANLAAEYANWRCPKCRVFLGMVFHPKFCPRCGERLR